MNTFCMGIPLSIFLFLACLSAQEQCVCTDCGCSDSLIPNFNLSNLQSLIRNNPNLATQSLVNYWNNGEGAYVTCRETDSLALVALYRATNMQNAPPQYKWNLSQPMTTWYGVTLNTEGCVTCLDLDGGAVDCGILTLPPTGIGLVGTLPDSIRLLSNLVRLSVQGNTGLGGVLPPNFGNLTSLKHFFAYNCRFTPPFPTSFWTLPNIETIDLNDNPLNIPFPSEFGNFKKLKELQLCTTGLTGTIPQSIGTLDSLSNLTICDNKLTGSVPTNLTTRTRLQVFQIEMNQLDDLPNFSALPFSQFFSLWTPFFSTQRNRFTFDDIVPNMPIINRINSTYALQDSIFQETTLTKNVGETASINLGIDGALTTNKYVWFKKQGNIWIRFDSSNVNTLILRGLSACDAGDYKCEVTNPNAPLLTLKSRTIKIVVNGALSSSRLDTAICYGETYRLPNLQTVNVTTNFRDTLKNSRQCDSLIRIVNLTVNPKINAQNDSLTIDQNKTDATINVLTNDIYPINQIDVNIKNKPQLGTIEEKGTGIFNIQMPRATNGFIVFSYEICPLSCPDKCDTALVKVFVKNTNPRDLISTAITPNGDGKNDVLDFPEIDWNKYPDARMEIFNRWGQIVFVDDHYKGKWAGQNPNGQDLMAGDYFFILRLNIGDGKIIVGSVYVQR